MLAGLAFRDRVVWLLRLLWFVLPVTVGPVVSDAVADDSDGRRIALTVGAWAMWVIGLACVAVLLPITLTGVRVLAPGAVAAMVAAMIETGVSGRSVAALAGVVITMFVAYSALVGDRMVDGASYGDERRMLLRPPTRLAVSVVPLTWLVGLVGLVAGPVLLASGSWIAGALATAAGLPVAALAIRALHQLSLRWIVFVPTGFVLHDLQVLTEPVLFRRTAIERLGPAIVGTPARDLSNRAAGLMIECELTDPAPLGLRQVDRTKTKVQLADVRRFLFVPSRPGALLDEAERRRIAVG